MSSCRTDHVHCHFAKGYEAESPIFWKLVLQHLTERVLGQQRVLQKGIEMELIPKLRSIGNGSSSRNASRHETGWWLPLRREYKCFLSKKDKVLYVFVAEFAPVLKGKGFILEDTRSRSLLGCRSAVSERSEIWT